MTTPDDRDPSPILALARELHDLLEKTCESPEIWNGDLGLALLKAAGLAEELRDAIEDDDDERMPTDEEVDRQLAALRGTPRVPNTLTRRTLADADAGRGLTGYGSVDEMFAAIAMNLIEMDDDMEPENESR